MQDIREQTHSNSEGISAIQLQLSSQKRLLKEIFYSRSATTEVWFMRGVICLFLVIVVCKFTI